jgi:hypothetical protein
VKKVKYAVGLLGMAPALGLMTPALAATTGSHAPEAKLANSKAKVAKKKVSLAHAVTPDVTCTGGTSTHVTNGQAYLKFFYTDHSPASTCIGTVKATLDYSHQDSTGWIHIYDHSNGGKKRTAYSHSWNTGSNYGRFAVSTGVHKPFGYSPIQVCIKRINNNSPEHFTYSVTCKSVG